MDRPLILKCDDAQEPTVKFGNRSPEPIAVVLLRLAANSILNNENAPFLLQVRAFPQYLGFKILRKPELGHYRSHRSGKVSANRLGHGRRVVRRGIEGDSSNSRLYLQAKRPSSLKPQ